MAVNCRVALTAKLAGDAGVTAIEVKFAVWLAAANTVKGTAVLFIPDRDALMLVFPAATPVARPAAEIVATLVLELVQVTCEVIFAVVAFE